MSNWNFWLRKLATMTKHISDRIAKGSLASVETVETSNSNVVERSMIGGEQGILIRQLNENQ